MKILTLLMVFLTGCSCLHPAHHVRIGYTKFVIDADHEWIGTHEVIDEMTVTVTDKEYDRFFGKGSSADVEKMYHK